MLRKPTGPLSIFCATAAKVSVIRKNGSNSFVIQTFFKLRTKARGGLELHAKHALCSLGYVG